MKKGLFPLLFVVITIATLAVGCRSNFERIRTSNNPELMLTTADSLYNKEEFGKAATLYELIVPAFRGKKEAEHIAFRIASTHYDKGSYVLSSHYFKQFANTYTTSERKEDALYQSAISYYRLSPRHQLDQTDSESAIEAFQEFVNAYPNSDKVEECNRYIDQLRAKAELKAFNSGKLYYHTRDYSSSIRALENLLKDYPGTEYAEESRYILIQANKDWAERSIFTKKEERFQAAVEYCDAYLKRHSTHERVEEVTATREQCNKEIINIQNG